MSDARVTVLWEASIAALKQVVREHRITQDELQAAGLFFNRLGQSGMFPSLLAVGLAMTSVEVTTAAAGATRPNLQGPFYRPGAPLRADGVVIEHPIEPGAPVLNLSGAVIDATTRAPVGGAELDLWQADHCGRYDQAGFHLRGVVRTDAQGRYNVRTLVPKDYSDHDHDPIGELFRAMGRHNRRAAHIHVKLRMNGVERLMTQLFIAGNEYLDSDYVQGAVSDDLVIALQPAPSSGVNPEFVAKFDFTVAA